MKQLVQQGQLKPITYAKSAISANFAPVVAVARDVQRQALRARLQGVEQVAALVQRARLQGGRASKPPKTWAQLLSDAQTLKASGTPAYSIGGSDGWTLTDLFENIYLRTFGPGEVRRSSRPTRSSGPTRR